jgi:diguanylate cyclase (GGDEF)-like protein/PAS domain S-box-containing protein
MGLSLTWLALTGLIWYGQFMESRSDPAFPFVVTYGHAILQNLVLSAFIAFVGLVLFKWLRYQEDLRIAATAFNVQEGVLVTDAKGVILRVNASFCQMTGYQPQEVIGKTPAILSSGRQDKDFYKSMWTALKNHGHWLGEIWNRKKSGEEYCERLSIDAVYDRKGQVSHYVAAFYDITRSKLDQAEIRRLAFYDPLTELANRRLLMERLEHALAASGQVQRYGALMYIDMDRFKTLNDTRGHQAGDEMLKQIAQRLQSSVREVDTVARLGGDEFVVLFEGLNQEKAKAVFEAERLAEKIWLALSQPYDLGKFEFVSTPSIGVTLFMDHRDGGVEDILRKADAAMYQAKQAGRNTIRMFDPEMQAIIQSKLWLEARLKKAVDLGELMVFYQPQMDANGVMLGAEALIRWQDPEKGFIPPVDFIPLAEENGLILDIGDFVLRQVAYTLSKWKLSEKLAGLTISVNISAIQLSQSDFAEHVQKIIEHYDLDPSKLKLELTESMMIVDTEDTIDKIKRLKSIGVQFSMDDFGTGYSSLLSIKSLPVDQVKIDQNFVKDLFNEEIAEILIQSILSLCNALNLTVVAEGVETQAHYEKLLSLGCQAFQGYYFAKPMSYEELVHFIIDQA